MSLHLLFFLFSWRAAGQTCTAPRQSLGSEVMVSVETTQPSRALSLTSMSIAMNGGLPSTYRWFKRKLSTLRRILLCKVQGKIDTYRK